MHRKPKVEKDNAERWLLTYADLMNLLLIFFIILYSMAQMDQQKFARLSASLKANFGMMQSGTVIDNSGAGDSMLPVGSADMPDEHDLENAVEVIEMQELKKRVDTLIEQQGMTGSVNTSLEERGVVVSITSSLLFKSGSAEIEPSSISVVESIGKILLSLPDKHVRVEGHTDNDPISTYLFPSNWELSSARATNVLRLLVSKSGLNPATISSVGYGEHRPKLPNTDEAKKSSNRRVDIVIIKTVYDKSEAGFIK